jgi:serine protease Do
MHMKSNLRYVIPFVSLVLLVPSLMAGESDESKQVVKKEKRIMAVPSGSHGAMPERQMKFISGGPQGGIAFDFANEGPPEMEMVTFLGVQTGSLSPTLNTQLGVAKGTGLVVVSIVEDSAATGVLQEHDILLKLDDQILVNLEQLSVLVRNKKKGEKVSLTYLRGGKENKANVTLGEHEVPKSMSMHFNHRLGSGSGPVMSWQGNGMGLIKEGQEDADKLLWMMDLSKGRDREAVIDTGSDENNRVSISINTGNGKMEFKDDEGSLELTTKEGKKELTAKDPKGVVVFTGPINTPEERAGLSPDLKQRLEKIEGMRKFQFHTDEAFEGAEAKVIQPIGRGAKLDLPRTPADMRRLDIF